MAATPDWASLEAQDGVRFSWCDPATRPAGHTLPEAVGGAQTLVTFLRCFLESLALNAAVCALSTVHSLLARLNLWRPLQLPRALAGVPASPLSLNSATA